MDEITVIGARSLGHVAAADLSLRGYKVNLYEEPRFKDLLETIRWHGGIDLLSERYYSIHGKPTIHFEKLGHAKVHRLTTNIEKAVRNSRVIIVGVHAHRHEKIAKLLAPHVKDGQTIVISAGNAGSLIFSKTFREMGVEEKVLLSETCPSVYNGRFGPEYGIGEAQCATATPVLVNPENPKARTTAISAFPAKDTDQVMENLKDLFKLAKGTNVLQVALSNGNLFVHVALCVMSASWIDHSEGIFRLNLQARTPSTMRVVKAVREERDAIFKAMGWTPLELTHMGGTPSKAPSPVKLHFGPTSWDKHRYIDEDARIGDTFLASLGDMIGVPTPTIKSLVHLASLVNQTNYFKTGRTVEKAGVAGLDIDELNRFLAEGHP